MASIDPEDLKATVRSAILENLRGAGFNPNADTQYTKSDGTNYGMYQKAGETGFGETVEKSVQQ